MARNQGDDGEVEFLRRRDEEHDSDEELEEEEERAEEYEEDEDEEEEITEYEKQRLKTIERNKAMLASLQLPNLASSLAQASTKAAKAETTSKPKKGGGPRRRSERLKSSVSGKRSAVDDESSRSDKSDSESESQISPNKRKRRDLEYEPTDSSGSESEDEMDEHEKEVLQEDPLRNVADMDEEEYALQQALALSLGASVGATDSPRTSKKKKKSSSSAKKRVAEESLELDPDEPKSKPSKGQVKRKTQKMSNKRHFSEGEVDALFPFFDERGKGRLTLNDLERVSTAHDFTWSQQELLDMIHLFNRSHTGVLDLVDFRNVAHRCNLIVSEQR